MRPTLCRSKQVQNRRDQPTDRRTATLSPPIKADHFSHLASVLRNSRREKQEGDYYHEDRSARCCGLCSDG